MKKQYIIPNTMSVSLLADSFICQVASVHSDTLGFGGNKDVIDPY